MKTLLKVVLYTRGVQYVMKRGQLIQVLYLHTLLLLSLKGLSLVNINVKLMLSSSLTKVHKLLSR